MDWIWDPEDLENVPSVKAGILPKEERHLRAEGIRAVVKIGKALNLPANPTLATASLFFHRFYMLNSFNDRPLHIVAVACLFLAGKVEETPKRGRDVVNTALDLFPKQMFSCIDPLEELMSAERCVLLTLRFDLHAVHPFPFVTEYAKIFNYGKDLLNLVVRNAWQLVKEQFGTTLCVLWAPEVIAIAMLYLALKLIKVKGHNKGLKEDANPKVEWWNMYVSNLTVEQIEEICHILADHWDCEESIE